MAGGYQLIVALSPLPPVARFETVTFVGQLAKTTSMGTTSETLSA
jgi:hypothetical protein